MIVKKLAPRSRVRLDVFDLLRGFYIFGIIVNHVALYPNIFVFLTGATRLWVSFAEGFFIVSGFFIGYLYKENIQIAFWQTTKKIANRSFRLYIWTVYLTLLFTYWGNFMPIGSVKGSLWIVNPGNLVDLIYKAMTFQYRHGWADILPFYCVYLLFAPFALLLLSKGWGALLFFLSYCVWLFRGQNSYMAIQILFFGGVVLGYYSEKIKIAWLSNGLPKRNMFKSLVVSTFLFTLLLCIFSVFYFPKIGYLLPNSDYWLQKNRVLNIYFHKNTLGLGRLILSPIWHLSLLFLFLRFKRQIKRYFGWILLLFGKRSLYAYIIHAFIIYPIPYLVSTYHFGGYISNSFITLFSVLLVYVFMRLTASLFRGKM